MVPHSHADDEGTASLGPALERAPLALVVTLPSGSTTTLLPRRGTLRIGRSPDCEVSIVDDSISRVHAILHLDPVVAVEDAGSRNGTVVLGARVTPRERIPLPIGAVLQLGHAVIVLVRHRAELLSPDADDMIAGSPPMRELEERISLVAPSLISVLVLGETGVGKDVVAREIHRLSTRAGGPFVAVNSAALADAILESELFGHARGAFTGAVDAKIGLIEAAHGGTLFLDEIGDLSLSAQAKLLRVLETGEVLPVGSVRPKKVDVRFVAATNRDVWARVGERQFRDDLYFRLSGAILRVPPLRERRSDIEALAARFAARAAARLDRRPPAFDPDALAALEAHEWPGNARELRSVVELAVALSRGAATLRPEHLQLRSDALFQAPPSVSAHTLPPPSGAAAGDERAQIVDALARAAGNQTVAAGLLGVSRRTLIRRMEEYGIARPRKSAP
jgi:two-component system, NtrC family, response regulator AtoC